MRDSAYVRGITTPPARSLCMDRVLLLLSAWIEYCYFGQPVLHLGDGVIHSCTCVQQGDPLGPLGFALTLHPVIEQIKAEALSLNMNAWYLDDGTLMGPPDAHQQHCRLWREMVPPLASISTMPSPSCLSPGNAMPLNPLYLLISPSGRTVFAFSAAP